MSETFERGKGLMAMENEGFCDEEERRQRGRASNKFLSPPSHQKPSLKQGHLDSKLKKSPSLMKMILCQDDAASVGTLKIKNRLKLGNKTDKKFKPTNFAALRLRIGSWEHKSNSAGLGLKAKIYFAQQKLIWELLDGDQKYKIEIEWSNITALNANCPHNQPGTLSVVLGTQPRLFKETDPEPKKQTRWDQTDDFTGRQASTYRLHFLEFPQGVLDKHFQKLIQCDTRLRLLSQLPETILDSPEFAGKALNSLELRDNVVNQFQIAGKPLNEREGFFGKVHEGLPKDNDSPTSVNTNSEVHKFQNLKDLQQLGVAVLGPSLSIDGSVGYVEPFFETDIDHDFEEYIRSIGHENKVHGDNVMVQEENGLNDVTSHKQLQRMSDSSVDFLHYIDDRVGYVEPFFETDIDPDVEEFFQSTLSTGHENKVHGDDVMVQEENGLNDVTSHKQLQRMSDSSVDFLHYIDDRVGYVEPSFEADMDPDVEGFFQSMLSTGYENKVHGDDVMVQEENGLNDVTSHKQLQRMSDSSVDFLHYIDDRVGYVETSFEADMDPDVEGFFQSMLSTGHENKVHGDDVMVQEENGLNDVTSHKQLQHMSDSRVDFLHYIDDRVGYVEPSFEADMDPDVSGFFQSMLSTGHEYKVHGDDVMVQEENGLNDVTSHKQLQRMSDSSVDFLHYIDDRVGYVEPSFEADMDPDVEGFFQSMLSTGHENKVHGDDVMVQEENGLNDVTSHKQLQCMSDSSVEFMHGLSRAFLPHS